MAVYHLPNDNKQDFSRNTDRIVDNLFGDPWHSQSPPILTIEHDKNNNHNNHLNFQQICEVRRQKLPSVEGYLACNPSLDQITYDSNKLCHVCRYPFEQCT